MKEKYLDKFMKIRPLIVGNKKIMKTIRRIIQKEELDESPYFIGKGKNTIVYGLGKLDDFKERKLFLAMRIGYDESIFNLGKEPFGLDEYTAEGEAGAFEEAFKNYNSKLNFSRYRLIPPFFTGVVKWRKKEKNLFGILTEDLSFGGKNKVVEDEWSERGIVIYPNRKSDNYFMDPRKLHHKFGKKYMKKGKIISLGRIN